MNVIIEPWPIGYSVYFLWPEILALHSADERRAYGVRSLNRRSRCLFSLSPLPAGILLHFPRTGEHIFFFVFLTESPFFSALFI